MLHFRIGDVFQPQADAWVPAGRRTDLIGQCSRMRRPTDKQNYVAGVGWKGADGPDEVRDILVGAQHAKKHQDLRALGNGERRTRFVTRDGIRVGAAVVPVRHHGVRASG